jgi:hypothetical protein
MQNTRLTSLLILAIAVLIALADASATETLTPAELVASTPKGKLKNPYSPSSAAAEQGHKVYMSLDGSGCHGGAVAAGWLRLSLIRFGSMAAMTTRSSD